MRLTTFLGKTGNGGVNANSLPGAKPTASANHSNYSNRRITDYAAIEGHLRAAHLSVKRIAQMYGLSLEEVQRLSDALWIKDPVYRINTITRPAS